MADYWSEIISRVHRKFGGGSREADSGIENNSVREELDACYNEICRTCKPLFAKTVLVYSANATTIDISNTNNLSTGKPAGTGVLVLDKYSRPRYVNASGEEYDLIPMDNIYPRSGGDPTQYRWRGLTIEFDTQLPSGMTIRVGLIYRGAPRVTATEASTSPTFNTELQDMAEETLVLLTASRLGKNFNKPQNWTQESQDMMQRLKHDAQKLRATDLPLNDYRSPIKDYFGGGL